MRRRNDDSGESAVGRGLRFALLLVVALAACDGAAPSPEPAKPRVETPKPAPTYRFRDAPYVADAAAWKSTAWIVVKLPPDEGTGLVFRAVEQSGANTVDRSTLRVSVVAYPQWVREGDKRVHAWEPFPHWGMNVPVSKVREFASANYENWIHGSVDVLRERCCASVPIAAGAADFRSRAVATDRTSRVREYRSWYVWGGDGPGGTAHTYVAEFVAAADPGRDDARDAAALELMKSIRSAPGRKRSR